MRKLVFFSALAALIGSGAASEYRYESFVQPGVDRPETPAEQLERKKAEERASRMAYEAGVSRERARRAAREVQCNKFSDALNPPQALIGRPIGVEMIPCTKLMDGDWLEAAVPFQVDLSDFVLDLCDGFAAGAETADAADRFVQENCGDLLAVQFLWRSVFSPAVKLQPLGNAPRLLKLVVRVPYRRYGVSYPKYGTAEFDEALERVRVNGAYQEDLGVLKGEIEAAMRTNPRVDGWASGPSLENGPATRVGASHYNHH